jgi:hypothetical protein
LFMTDVYKQNWQLQTPFTIHFNIDAKTNEQTMQICKTSYGEITAVVGLVCSSLLSGPTVTHNPYPLILHKASTVTLYTRMWGCLFK